MRYWFDTEFYDQLGKIDLISIGLVAEDGRELYIENVDFDWAKVPADHWIQTNVKPHLKGGDALRSYGEIGPVIQAFIGDDKPQFWAYFAAYDWTLFCWLFGSMIDLPRGWPQYVRDLKQWAVLHGNPQLLPKTGTVHNALDDARWTREAWLDLAKMTGIEHP